MATCSRTRTSAWCWGTGASRRCRRSRPPCTGALDQRIEVSSRDELGALAEEFNRMAGRLQESYTGLERKVQERTRELAEALAELDEKSREVETASRHKSEFLASMSHELRT